LLGRTLDRKDLVVGLWGPASMPVTHTGVEGSSPEVGIVKLGKDGKKD
jgi:hypothetical protein